MSRSLRAAQIVVSGMLVTVSALSVIGAFSLNDLLAGSVRVAFAAIIAIASLLAVVGIWRRVVWGRFLASCVIVIATFAVVGLLLPNIDAPGQSFPELWLGQLPPIWLHVALLVIVSTILLLPLLILGWHRNGFRRSLW